MKSVKLNKPALRPALIVAAFGVFIFVGGPFAQDGEAPAARSNGVLEKLNVAQGNVAMLLDGSQFGGASARQGPLEFSVSPGSFLTALVFNGTFRAVDSGALRLTPSFNTRLPA